MDGKCIGDTLYLAAFGPELQTLLENEKSRERLLKEIGQVSNK